jgi:hypothetical protein
MAVTPGPRIFGALTAAYGVSALWTAAPLTRHGELGDPSNPPPAARLLSTTFGVRDLVSGLAIMAAPRGVPLRTALALRVAFDAGDAVGFALYAPTPRARTKIGLIAGAWAGVGLLALSSAGKRGG